MKEFYYLVSWSEQDGWELKMEDVFYPDTPIFDHDLEDWTSLVEEDQQQDSDNLNYLKELLNGQA